MRRRSDKRVKAALALAGDEGACAFPLADATGLQPVTVYGALRRLSDQGRLRHGRVPGDGRVRYWLVDR